MACGLGLADVLGEQVDQDDAAEIGGRGLELAGDTVENPLRQLVIPSPAACEVETFPLVLDEGPVRVRDLEGPLFTAQHEPVDRDPWPVRRGSDGLERVDDYWDHHIPDDLEEVQFLAGRHDLDNEV